MDESTTFGNKRFLVQLMVSGSRTSLKAFTIKKWRLFNNWLNKLVRLTIEKYFCPILIYLGSYGPYVEVECRHYLH